MRNLSASTEFGDPGRRPPWVRGWLTDSALMIGSQGLLTATALVIMLVLARNLTKSEFGLFSSLLGISTALSFVVDSGITTWLLRESSIERASTRPRAEQNRKLTALLEQTMAVTGTVGIVLAFGTAAFASLGGLDASLACAQGLFTLYITILAWNTAFESVQRSDRLVRSVVIAGAAERFSLLILIGCVLALGGSVLAVSVAYVLAGTIRLARNEWVITRRVGTVIPHMRRGAFRVVGRTGHFAFNSAAMTFFPRIDTAIVATVSLVGASYFAIGFQIVTSLALIPLLAGSSLFPFLSAGAIDRKAEKRILALMAVAGLLIAIAGILAAPVAVPALFGSRYRSGVGVVQIAMLGVPALFLAAPMLTFLYGRHLERTMTWWILCASVIGTVAVVVGALAAGAAGAAGAFAGRYALQAAALGYLIVKARRSNVASGISIAPTHHDASEIPVVAASRSPEGWRSP